MQPKQLRKVTDNQIFAWTEKLAMRADMVPYFGPGDSRNEHAMTGAGGITINTSENESKLKLELREKSEQILRLEKQTELLGDENMKLNQQVEDLKNQLVGEIVAPDELKETPLAVEAPPLDNLSANDRMKALVTAAVKMIEKADKNDFTGQGLPRVERLEVYAGIAEVTANEREKAYEQAKIVMQE